MKRLAEVNSQDILADALVENILDIAIIGAGIAGLTAASRLFAADCKVAVFEKARGTGGRLSSKRVAYNNAEAMAFDLGCVSIKAQGNAFTEQLARWHDAGVILPWWSDEFNHTHYVAHPRNSALTRHLSNDIECHFGHRVNSIERKEGIWHLFELVAGRKKLLARTYQVVLAVPAAQAFDLLPSNHPFKHQLKQVDMAPQWVMAVEVDNDLSSLPVMQYPISELIFSISQESAKPMRFTNHQSTTVLQIQAQSGWSERHLEASTEDISRRLITELELLLKQPLAIMNTYVHRWLYATTRQGILAKEGYLLDDEGLALIGDYFCSEAETKADDFRDASRDSNSYLSGVESAWLSGQQLAQRLVLNISVADR